MMKVPGMTIDADHGDCYIRVGWDAGRMREIRYTQISLLLYVISCVKLIHILHKL